MTEVAKNIVAGIFVILAMFWLLNPRSQAPAVISSLSQGILGTIQGLQGYSPTGGGQFYGGGA